MYPFFYTETEVGYELPDCTVPQPIRQLSSELILLLDTERQSRSATALCHSQRECRSVAQIPQLANTVLRATWSTVLTLFYTHTHTHTRAGTHTHARAHTHTRGHTHTHTHTHHNVPDITLCFVLRVGKKKKKRKLSLCGAPWGSTNLIVRRANI
jgi:hypothetical protein